MEREWCDVTQEEAAEALKGGVISGLKINDTGYDSYLIIQCEDGRVVRVMYDWIYGFEVLGDRGLKAKYQKNALLKK